MEETNAVETATNSSTETTESNNPETAEQKLETGVQATETNQQAVEQKPESSATTSQTAKPEFADPNMNARFTQKMQELSTREAEYKKGLQKIQAFEALEKNPKFIEWATEHYGEKKPAKPVLPEITDEQFVEATTNPAKFRETIVSLSTTIAKAMLDEQLAPYKKDIEAIKADHATKALEQDIDDFANSKDASGKPLYPDFWSYSPQVQGYLEKFQNMPMTNPEKLELAYKLAKYPNMVQETIAKAHNLVNTKKLATTEKGGISNANVKKVDKNMSLNDFIDKAADEIKWN